MKFPDITDARSPPSQHSRTTPSPHADTRGQYRTYCVAVFEPGVRDSMLAFAFACWYAATVQPVVLCLLQAEVRAPEDADATQIIVGTTRSCAGKHRRALRGNAGQWILQAELAVEGKSQEAVVAGLHAAGDWLGHSGLAGKCRGRAEVRPARGIGGPPGPWHRVGRACRNRSPVAMRPT